MRHTLITLLAVITLLSQWGWVEHAYHEHLPDEVCEVCVSASGHIAVPPIAPQFLALADDDFVAPPITTSHTAAAPRCYPARAPPRFL